MLKIAYSRGYVLASAAVGWATLTDMFAKAVRDSHEFLRENFSRPGHSRILVCKLWLKNGIIFLELPVLT